MKLAIKRAYTWFVTNITKKMDFIGFLFSGKFLIILVKIFILLPIFVHYQHILLKDFIKRNGGLRKDTMGGGEGMRRY